METKKERASERAEGFWPDILSDAGVQEEYLGKKNGPCPFCGGSDRFRFRDKSHGLYVCSACTNGKYRNGLDFLMRHMGYRDIREAAAHVHRWFDGDGGNERVMRERPVSEPESGPEFIRKRLWVMNKILSETRAVTDGDPVDRYLRRRIPNLPYVPEGIRFHPKLPYWEGRNLVGHFAAMVVAGIDADNNLVQIHKTYLTADGQKADVPNVKKTDMGIGCTSYALRLMPIGDSRKLGTGEGIETGLASWARYGVPTWACHCESVLANFVVPTDLQAQIDSVMIFADHDQRKKHVDGRLVAAGGHAGARLAQSLRKCGKRSLILMPAKVSTDMDDLGRATA